MASRLAAPHGVFGGILLALLTLALAAGVRAEDQPPRDPPAQAAKAPSGQKGGAGQNAPAVEQHRLPPDSTTRHTLALSDRTLSFTAVAGSIRLFDDKGEPQADVAYTSYQLDGADRGARPVTFLFNGGPGASSAWLQL
ncbi:MAG TPA: peptidase S10, partial [Bradyrhizobium sp.]